MIRSPYLTSQKIHQFQTKILTWYEQNKRSLPWRDIPFDKDLQVRDPYKILISEIMSQQTQIDRVIPKYEAWLTHFPTVTDLAQASVTEVLQYWSGLGYNRRALNLKKTAEIVATRYHGKFPQDEKELLALPGIGAYTARAILCFAFNQQVAVVDTNVRKVILTQFPFHHREASLSDRGDLNQWGKEETVALTDKEIEAFAEQLVPHGKAYEWNQALMDYASTVLKKEKITIPKQSTFKGSRRYYRGLILKLLLQKQQITIVEIMSLVKDSSGKDQSWMSDLLNDLEKEGFIMLKDKQVFLKK